MKIEGYAFKADEKETRAKYAARMVELREVAKGVKLNKSPSYGQCLFTGTLNTPEAQALSELDIALIADHGNLCFGGECIKTGITFRGNYWTD